MLAGELPGLLAMIAAILYVLGLRRPVRGSSGRRAQRIALLRATAFIASLATIIVALSSPFDNAADQLLWVHMAQHVLLLLVAQGWQLFDPGFSPYHGGAYGSIFVGFTATLFAHLIGATYWLETVVVSSGSFHRERA
ncbi:MAG: hypothetical protein QOJ47_1054, partial [Gaiellales bacterium]|nr:hypothetical protein [Gaiellales bacterium]